MKLSGRCFLCLAAIGIVPQLPQTAPLPGFSIILPAHAQFGARPPKTEGEKAVYEIYRQSLAADKLFSEKKWNEAAKVYEDSMAAMTKAFRRENFLDGYHFPVRPNELQAARRIPEQVLGERFNELQDNGIVATRYVDLMEKMLQQTRIMTGTAGEFWSDETIAEYAYDDIRQVQLPVPDSEWSTVVMRLELAAEKLQGVFQRSPKLEKRLLNSGRWPGVTGAVALKEANDKLAEARPELERAQAKLAKSMPSVVEMMLNSTLQKLDKMKGMVQKDGFIVDEDSTMLTSKTVYLARLRNTFSQAYSKEGRTMPADLLNPVSVKIDEVNAVIGRNASRFSFPTGTVRDAAVEARVRRQLNRNLPKAKILRIAMKTNTWSINKNDWGLPEDRYKHGYVLYQMPGEKWARLNTFVYRENYAGGGRYTPGDGASSYGMLRWQKPQ